MPMATLTTPFSLVHLADPEFRGSFAACIDLFPNGAPT